LKKILLSAFFLLSVTSSVYSQDKIITLNYDTIDCRISKISNNTIFFEVYTKGVRSTGKIPLTSVLNYTISGNPVENKKANRTIITDPFLRLRLGFNGGIDYLFANSKDAEAYMSDNLGITSSEAKSYYRDLKLGYHANGSLTYLITPEYGAGIKYSFFSTSAGIESFVDPQDGVHLIYASYNEQIYVNFIGAVFYAQQTFGNKSKVLLNSACSFGLATYRNEAEYLKEYYLITGMNIGTDVSIGFEYFINRSISVGADLSALFSSIRKMEITDGINTTTIDLDKENYENLSRIGISAGIRFYLWNK
jgi:hypothetical protein